MAETTNVAIQQRDHSEASERSAQAIRHDIAAKRDSISETVEKLGERVQETFDWREYVAKYPAVTLGLAAGAGFLVAGIFKRRPTPRERIFEAVAELVEDATDRAGGVVERAIQKKPVSRASLGAAIGAVATKAAVDLIKKKFADNGPRVAA